MRVDQGHTASAGVRIRPALDAASGWWRQVGARLRWLLGGVLGLGLIIGAALFYASTDQTGSEWLYNGRSFSAAESARIVAALRSAEIPCVESAGKVGVPALRRAEAMETLARARIGPRPIDELLDDRATGGSIWELPDDREKRDLRGKEKIASEVIARFGGVVSATVILTPVTTGSRINPARSLKATALIQTEEDHPLPNPTVDRICLVLTSIDAVDPNAITVIDPTNGRDYRVAGRPDLEARSSVSQRENELREKITNQLRIEGSLVHVRIDSPGAENSLTETLLAEPIRTADTSTLAENQRPPRVGVNRPLVSDPEPERAPEGAASPAPQLLVNAVDSRPHTSGPAHVLVQVPRSHYLRLFQAIHPSEIPTPEELAPFAARVRETIQTVVDAVIPARELASLHIVRIDDTVAPPPSMIDSLGTRKAASSWLPVLGALGAAGLVLVVAGGGWMAVRRPSNRSDSAAEYPSRQGTNAAATAAGPAERVRELIRLDPGAAAGVLHRWIAQGEHAR